MSTAPPIQGDPWIEATFRRALAQQRRGGRDGRAASLYRSLLRRNPGHFGSWINLGVLEYERGKPGEAVRCFTQAHGLRPEAPEASYNLGKALRASGDRRSAQKFLEMAYEANPGDPTVLAELGELYVETDRLAAAEALYLDGLERQHDATAPRVLQARIYQASGQFEAAAEVLEDLCRHHPGCHEAFALLGEVRYHMGQIERAGLALRQALLIHPQSAPYHRQLGIYLSASGHHEPAHMAFRKARKLSPGIATPPSEGPPEERDSQWEKLRLQASLLERSRAHAEKGNWKAGVAEFLALTARYPLESVIWQELGWFYEKLDEPRRALHLYRRAQELDPANLEVELRIGRILLDLGQIDEVEALLLGLDPAHDEVPEVLELHAGFHRASGDSARGRSFYERALERMPNRISALKGIGACLLDEEDLPGATEAWTQAFRAFPGDPELARDLSALLIRRGQAQSAERVLRAAVERCPGHTRIHRRLARLLLEGRRFTAARKAYKRLTLDCTPENLEQAVDMLEAQVYCRDLRASRRLVRQLVRFRSRGAEPARISLLEFVLAVLSRDATKFSLAWQRAWRENPRLDVHARFLAGLFEPADMDFFLQEARRSAFLFQGDQAVHEGLARLAEELTPGGALRSLPGSG